LAAKYLKVLIPYLVVQVDGILAVFWYLKEYLLCLIVIKSCKYKGLVLQAVLGTGLTNQDNNFRSIYDVITVVERGV
jgi:hypothetical protein